MSHIFEAYDMSLVQTDQDVKSMLQRIRTDPRTENPQVLGINMRAMAMAKNNGYPKPMYHATLSPEWAFSERDEDALAKTGFRTQYIARAFPVMMHRRNMSKQYAPKPWEYAHKEIPVADRPVSVVEIPYVESRTFKTEAELKIGLAAKPPKGCSEWFPRLELLPPLADGPDEDPAVTQARLEGQIEEMRRQLATIGAGKAVAK